jgi:4-hydroxy 2-oxovalerate aldolase
MNISILDCTLRDGGYINGWSFGERNISAITEGLLSANIDVIECGFLKSGNFDRERSLYSGVEGIRLPHRAGGSMFVAMIAYGDISPEEIAPRKSGFIDGIRLTFHDSEWRGTKSSAYKLMDKGYKVFIQPVGTISYTDDAMLRLIDEVNELNPYAFYLVDTLGSMYKNDLLRLYYLVDHNLSPGISIGFHSHNNLQLSFSNAMTVLELHTKRNVIIDSSIFGMGRGAGNLNTELITHFINENIGNRYELMPLLELMDNIILPIYKDNPWGFSEPYYLAAIRGVHPSYASYLIDKQSIPMTKVDEILGRLPIENRHLFKKDRIEQIYISSMDRKIDDSKKVATISKKVENHKILVIVPGSSVKTHSDEILRFVDENSPFIISVNFIPDIVTPDLVFVGNQKRYDQLPETGAEVIVSSNISARSVGVVDFNLLLTDGSDKSGLMILQLLKRIGATEAHLAGYDGFRRDFSYTGKDLDNYLSKEAIDELNSNMSEKLSAISKSLRLEFITPTVYAL